MLVQTMPSILHTEFLCQKAGVDSGSPCLEGFARGLDAGG